MGEKMGECNNGGRRGFSFQRLKLSLPAVIIGAAVLIISLQSVGQAVGQSPAGEQQQKQGQKPEQGKTPEPEEETIVIKSNLIAVPVSVTNASGEPVRNLKIEDFQLEEEGQVQQIQNLGEPGKTPIELALLFDVSR
ncbi:MAG: hypothetical protein J2P31_14495, partial [Blastocatellia bacterium]|nr:hypothetical protein [Blastocatellia bacterium]